MHEILQPLLSKPPPPADAADAASQRAHMLLYQAVAQCGQGGVTVQTVTMAMLTLLRALRLAKRGMQSLSLIGDLCLPTDDGAQARVPVCNTILQVRSTRLLLSRPANALST